MLLYVCTALSAPVRPDVGAAGFTARGLGCRDPALARDARGRPQEGGRLAVGCRALLPARRCEHRRRRFPGGRRAAGRGRAGGSRTADLRGRPRAIRACGRCCDFAQRARRRRAGEARCCERSRRHAGRSANDWPNHAAAPPERRAAWRPPARHPESPYRRGFTGLRWFAIDPKWRIAGRLVPDDTPRPVEIQNILGDVETMQSPGEVEAAVNGTVVRLAALNAARGRLWLIFSDPTAGDLHLPHPLPLHGSPRCVRRGRRRLQPRLQPAVRLQPAHDMPAAAAAEQTSGRRHRRRAEYAGHGSANSND